MGFTLNETNLAFQEAARTFAQKEIKPNAEAWNREAHFPREIWKGLGEGGFLGAAYPSEYGGSELGFLNMVLAAEQIGLGCPDLVTAFNINACTVGMALLNWGSEEQKTEFLAPLIGGDLIGSFLLTEPGGGSDALGSMRTRATKDGEDWVIHGSKTFISLSPVADIGVVFVKTDPDASHAGVSAFIFRYDDPGVSVTPMQMAHGLGSILPIGEVSFDTVRVPASRLLGGEGNGFKVAMNALDYGRLGVATKSLATGQVILDAAVEYSQTRLVFGEAIGHFQLIQSHIAEMAANLEAGRYLLYGAASEHDQGAAATRLSALAKYYMAETTFKAANSTMEIFGGYGLTEEFPIVHYLHLAHLARTGEGSANILRVALANDALGYRPMSRHSFQHRVYSGADQ